MAAGDGIRLVFIFSLRADGVLLRTDLLAGSLVAVGVVAVGVVAVGVVAVGVVAVGVVAGLPSWAEGL